MNTYNLSYWTSDGKYHREQELHDDDGQAKVWMVDTLRGTGYVAWHLAMVDGSMGGRLIGQHNLATYDGH